MSYESDLPHDIPKIPTDLIAEFYRNNVVIFTGSGVSNWAVDDFGNTAPSWNGLLRKLVLFSQQKGFLSDENRISELNNLIDNGRSVDDMLVAANYIVKKYRENNEDISGYLFQLLSEYKGLEVISDIAALPCRGFITTNYDTFIENNYPKEKSNLTVISASNDLTLKYIESDERPWLIKLHGRIGFSSRFVLSYDQYESAYSDGKLNTLLSVIMSKHTILFLGFGFRDPPIMDCIRSIARTLGPAKKRHYAIGDSASIGTVKSRFLKENFDIESLRYRVIDVDTNFGKNIGHEKHSNFPKTIKNLNKEVNSNNLLSTRVLFLINHPLNSKQYLQESDKFLVCSLEDNSKTGVFAGLLYPSIEWTQLIFSELRNLKNGNYRALNLDICEHFAFDQSHLDKILWYPLGRPFWDKDKAHLSSGIPKSKFYFQFAMLDINNVESLDNAQKILDKFNERDSKYAYRWASIKEMQSHVIDSEDDYNNLVIKTCLDLLDFADDELK